MGFDKNGFGGNQSWDQIKDHKIWFHRNSLQIFTPISVNSPDNMLVTLDPVLYSTAHHQLLFLAQSIGVATVFAVEILQGCWCTILSSPVRFSAVDCADVQVVVRVLFIF